MTTPVGDIRLDLKIDGSGLPTEILREIQTAMAPALRDLQRRLNAVERDYKSLTRESEKSAAQQDAAAQVVSKAVEDIGREHAKTAAKAQAAAGLSTRALNAQTRAVLKQKAAVDSLARSWEKVAAAQTAAAAAPTPGGPIRGGGGGGGGGFRRGGRYTSGPLGAAVFNAGALTLGSWPAMATVLTDVTGGLQQLTQLGLALPGVFAGAASSIATAVVGFQGLGDAIGALNEAAKSGDPKDLEKVAEALKDMDVNAVNTAKAISRFTQGPWKELQKNTAHNMFEGIDATLDELATRTMPTLTRGTAQVGSAWNKTFKELGRVVGLDSTQSMMDKVFGNTAEAQTRANAAIQPLIHGMGTLTAEGTDFLPRLADGLEKVTTRFDNWITKSAENGNLDRWIDQALTGTTQLGESFLNLGKVITNITKAAGADQGGFLQWLESATGRLAEFTGSAEGQERLGNFFREGREQIQQWLPVLRELGEAFKSIYEASKQWTAVLLPVLETVLGAINALPGGLEAATIALLAFKTIAPFGGLITALTRVDGLLGGINSKAGSARGALGGSGSLLGPGLALAAGGLLTTPMDGSRQPNGLSALATLGGGALIGAQFGGPVGAAFGTLAGAAAALTQAFINQANRIDNLNKQHRDWLDSRPPGLPAQVAPDPSIGAGAAVAPPPASIKPSAKDWRSMLVPGALAGERLGPFGSGLPVAPPNLQSNLPQVAGLSGEALAEIANMAKAATGNVDELGNTILGLPKGEVQIDQTDTEKAAEALRKLGYAVTRLPEGRLKIQVQYLDPRGLLTTGGIGGSLGLRNPDGTPIIGGGRAGGGVLPGYSPGIDNMLVPMSGGEGVLIPEAVRALGPGFVYAINSMFRPGLSRRGYAGGGVIGFESGGVVPGMSPIASDIAAAIQPVVNLLQQILAVLGGKPGDTLATQIGDETATALTSAAGSATSGSRPWMPGDPIPGWDLTPGWLMPQRGAGGVLAGGAGGAVSTSAVAAALAAFARSGNISDLAGSGLDASDSVVKAIVSARGRKRNNLGADTIASLVEQIVAGGGYTGALTPENTSLIGALQKFRDKLATGSTSRRGGATSPVPVTIAGFGGPQGSKAGLTPAASALWDIIAQNFPQVREIGGVRQDRHPDHPSGRALDIMIPGGTTRGGANPAGKVLGDQMWNFLAGNGLIDPNRSLWQTDTGGDHFDHIHAVAAEGAMLGVRGALMPGGSDPFSSIASNMCGCVGDAMGGLSLLSGQPGQQSPELQALTQALTGAVNAVLPQMMTDVLGAVLGQGDREMPEQTASALDLIKERNPAAIAAMLGYQVGDYNRTGSQGQADNLFVGDGPKFDSRGALMTDTAALIDRSFTSMEAANQARHQQLMDILTQVRDQLVQITSQMAQAALNAAGGAAGQAVPGMAAGGMFRGPGTGTSDSMLARVSNGEFITRAAVVARNPGLFHALNAGLIDPASLPRFATGGGVIVNDVVGAEFFGVSQIPIIGLLVNILVRILLAVLGVQIEARDTLAEVTDEFRQFRGDFKAFDAGGRLFNDTSALAERSMSTTEMATQERIRILKIVISQLIQYIIERVIVPMAKAIWNAVLSFASQAASSAITAGMNAAFPGGGAVGGLLGNLASSAITGIGGAAVEVWSEILSDIWVSLFDVLVDIIGDGLLSYFPNIMAALLGGGLIEQLIAGPLQLLLNPIEVLLGLVSGGLTALLGSLGGGLAAIFSGLGGSAVGLIAPLLGIVGGLGGAAGGVLGGLGGALGGLRFFDQGGMARGVGFIPKATLEPERVLSPSNTIAFDRLPDKLERLISAIERSGGSDGASFGDVHIVVDGGPDAGRNVADSLMELVR
ncbi:hypothetical protein H7I53_17890 [Mycolicibacterium pulveris]|uniref:ARB-07466-like C-terminal domain-containing protein n=1 Tax=Mycolicibacterium pulveris TaxID=36813 RepID=A0A7I7UCQ3_MYCPV|nr:hypothetical protein [Mycolicibacterium pulveris]MCV6982089.1 hypothetical protein [Mycolicibacterium pulveris]BBY78870.1 hypothetical protein MPUL_00280 [Mycolicibacterium pulveris]